jgi:hypothetical protein
MKETKLIEILNTFDLELIEDLKAFSQMSYLKLKTYEIAAFILIIDKYKANELNVEESSKQVLIKRGLNLNDNKWRTIKSRLLQVIYEFIVLQQVRNTHHSRIQIASYFVEHQANKNLSLFLQKTEKQILEEPQSLNIDYYKFRLNELKLIQKQPLIENMEELKEMDKALDSFYLVNKLKLLTEMYNRRNIMNDNISGLDETVSNLEYAFDLDGSSEIIKISSAVLSLIRNRTQIDFIMVKQLIKENQTTLANDFIEDIYIYLLNFCANAFNRGEEIYAEEYINLIKKLIEKKWLIKKGVLSEIKYANTITCAIIKGEINWLRSFVEKFSKYLKGTNKVAVKMLDKAHIEFYDGEIATAKEILDRIKLKDPYLKIRCRKLILQIHYEEGIFKVIDSELEAMRQFVYRNEVLSKKKRLVALNFIKAMKLLVNGEYIDLNDYKGKITQLDRLWFSKHIKGNK